MMLSFRTARPVALASALLIASHHLRAQVAPVLALPEAGLDDAAAYLGYQTRLFRDGARNTLQIYIDERAGRVVHVWANAENESIGFTARAGTGAIARLSWDGSGATMIGAPTARTRTVEHRLRADAAVVHLGWFLLGTMRVERDFLYEERQRAAFASPPFRLPEYDRLLQALRMVAPATQRAHLALLNARDISTLEARRQPVITVRRDARVWLARVVQPSLDGRDTITLEIRANPAQAIGSYSGDSVTLRARTGNHVPFVVRVSTTGKALTPLSREEIFTPEFLRFLATTKALATDPGSVDGLRARRLERTVRGVELLSSREKLMAGLPTYATYFGRDMLVSALMMRPIWRGTMSEAAIAAALRKLSPTGEVSHEEALGGQAVREAAAEYASLIALQQAATGKGDRVAADSLLRAAGDVLRHARRVRENYHMVDDEFQLPVLVARWITDSTISAASKRAFLRADGGSRTPRATLLLRELALVARLTAPYAADASARNLISFAPRDVTGWASQSWRDSGVGYAGGRYAMDVNVIWAPQALESMQRILSAMRTLGVPVDSIVRTDRSIGAAPARFAQWSRDSSALDAAIRQWRGASRHFLVQLAPSAVRDAVEARVAAMPTDERAYWSTRASAAKTGRDSLSFLALALDANTQPIAVPSSDPATRLFLGEREGHPTSLATGDRAETLRDVRLFTRPYPIGLLVDRIGPVVANDAYANASVWTAFVKDPYHGPRVIWGREVNLFLLGLAERVREAAASRDPATMAYVRELREAIIAVRGAVEASGFHSELWSYGLVNGQMVPQRYGSGADVQLWSTTDLAVAFALSRIADK